MRGLSPDRAVLRLDQAFADGKAQARSGALAVISYAGDVEAYTGSAVGALTALPVHPRSGTRPTLGGVTYFYTITAGTVVRLRLAPGFGRGAFALRTLAPLANDDFAINHLYKIVTTHVWLRQLRNPDVARRQFGSQPAKDRMFA